MEWLETQYPYVVLQNYVVMPNHVHAIIEIDSTEEPTSVSDVLVRMKRVLKSAQNKSMWVRLLISYHLEFIYGPLSKDSKQINAYLKDEQALRKESVMHFKITDKKARSYYEFLRFCDRLSLVLCNDETPERGRLLEINTSIKGDTYFIEKTEKDELIITPWIFSTAKFEVSVEERILTETQFSSSKKFQNALMSATPQDKTWVVMKASE